MATYTTNLKSWGANGNEYPDGYKYEKDVPPVDVYDNFLISNLINDVTHLIGLTNDRIETDSGAAGAEPSSPESTHIYGDQTNNRLRSWDQSSSSWRDLMFRDGDTMTGSLTMNGNGISAVGSISDTNGNIIFDSANSNVPVSIIEQGSGSGLDADKVDGTEGTELGSNASDDGNLISSPATDFNFGQNLSVSDDGDGTVTVSGANQPNTQTAVSESGTEMYSSVQDINFQGHLNVIDGGDGTVSIDPTHNHDTRYYTQTELDDMLANASQTHNAVTTSGGIKVDQYQKLSLDFVTNSPFIIDNGELDIDASQINHQALTISSDDHHSRYTDDEARNAVSIESKFESSYSYPDNPTTGQVVFREDK